MGKERYKNPIRMQTPMPSEMTRANTSMGVIRMDGMSVELRSKFSG